MRPVELGGLAFALLVRIGGAVVGVEVEVRVGAGVDAYLRQLLVVVGAFNRSAEGKDGAGADEDGDGVNGGICGNCLAAVDALVGPEVIPV